MTLQSDSALLTDNEANCLPCTPLEEKRIIRELTDSSTMSEDDIYFLLSTRWYQEWERYVERDDELVGFGSVRGGRPGPIDNSDLVVEGTDEGVSEELLEIKTHLSEGSDFVLMSEQVWKKLHDWYKGGPVLPRKVIAQGSSSKELVVEVCPLRLKLTDSRDDKQYVIQISKTASVRELYNRVTMLLGLEEEKIRIWDYFNQTKYSALDAKDKPIGNSNLFGDQDILVEVNQSGSWPAEFEMNITGNELALVPAEPSSITIAGGPSLSNGSSTGYRYSLYEGNSLHLPLTDVEDGCNLRKLTKGDRGGLAGLQNLGNTCFMNSAIQCLVHTDPLVEYFLQDYSEEINKQNPIGMQGELAIAFGGLLRKLWSSGQAAIAPRVFKAKLGGFAPQFSGYNQHDSHELLAFLLDGLHEDLNRVKFKPYIEMKDTNGRSDVEVANECWDIHKARNDSIIVDACQGQYKSTLVCPVCSKVSVTFDPFMYLSLPLPSRVTRSMTITVFFGDGRALPMPYTVTVLKHGSMKDLVKALGNACCLKRDEVLLLAEVYEHRIFRYLDNPFDPLTIIKDDEQIVGYIFQNKGITKVEIIHQTVENGVRKRLGTPLVACLEEEPQDITDIQNAVRMVLNPFLKIKPSNPVHTSMDDGSASEINVDGPDETANHVCELGDQALDKMELGQLLDDSPSFSLSLANDGKGINCSSTGNSSLFESDNFLRVTLDWSDREHAMYDIGYLEDLPDVYKTGFTAKKLRQEAISLYSCMEAFLKEEPLGPDDMWYCPTCKEHRQATKKLDLWRLPEVLVIHLKRFSYSRYLKNKLETFVNFPIHDLDLRNYVKSNTDAPQSHLYELYAVSNHYGGLGGGHYSAYAKLNENRWYHFDDSYVSPISEDEVKTSAAYVLFYRRVQETAMDDSSHVPLSSDLRSEGS